MFWRSVSRKSSKMIQTLSSWTRRRTGSKCCTCHVRQRPFTTEAAVCVSSIETRSPQSLTRCNDHFVIRRSSVSWSVCALAPVQQTVLPLSQSSTDRRRPVCRHSTTSCRIYSTKSATSSTAIDSSRAVTSTAAAPIRRPSPVSCRRYWQRTVCASPSRPPRVEHRLPATYWTLSSQTRTPGGSHGSSFSRRTVSDHDLVTWSWTGGRCRPPRRVLTYRFRNMKSINWAQFNDDVRRSSLFTSPADNANDFADQLDNTVSGILDCGRCPIQVRRKFAPNRRDSRWLSVSAVEAKRVRRRLERKWRTTRAETDYTAYRKACRHANKSIIDSRRDFYRERISAACDNPRKRWTAIRDVLHLSDAADIRSPQECKTLCDNFAAYFVDKIRKIKTAIRTQLANSHADPLQSDPPYSGPILATLSAPSVDEVRKLINSMAAKSSPIDSIPTSVLKSCVDVFAPLIARLTTLCFEEGVFPTRFKTACVTPLLKKKNLDSDIVANYRPISNLHTISKIVERLFMSRVIGHVESAPCFNRFQSAYRRGHSTETALLRLLNDTYCAADNKSRTLLIQLDLSAAFDTIDQDTLLRRLEHTFGLSGSVIRWAQSYISGRSQFVRVGDDQSAITTCEYGVAQGSVLGPLLYTLYVAPTASVIASFNVNHVQYADDTQLYIALDVTNDTTQIDSCFQAVQHWFALNGLSLNPDKSEAVVIGTGARQRAEGTIKDIALGTDAILVSDSVKSLGVTIDKTLSFDKHIDDVCKAAHHHIRAFRHIRKCISDDDAKQIAVLLVSARLDYCNSVLYKTSQTNIAKLQRVHNALARAVTCTRKRDHITPILADLHWLPIAARIDYKIALVTFKTLTTKQPSYLYELLQLHRPTRQLRSNLQENRLHDFRARTAFGSRAFCHAAPTVWNSLPIELTNDLSSLLTFKRNLKTFLYNRSFNH